MKQKVAGPRQYGLTLPGLVNPDLRESFTLEDEARKQENRVTESGGHG